METIQQHNRPPQEFIDCYNEVKNDIFNYLELKEIISSPEKKFVFIVPELSIQETITFDNLQIGYVFSKLNKEYTNFRDWFKRKVNSVYQSRI